MRQRSILPFLVAVLVSALFLVACTGGADTETVDDAGSGTGHPSSGQPSTVDQSPDRSPDSAGAVATGVTSEAVATPVSELDPVVRAMVTNLGDGYRTADGVWPGFSPNDHPTVVVLLDDDGQAARALAVNHPGADRLGSATPIGLDGLPFQSLHLVTEPADPAALAGVAPFEFSIDLGGVDSFAITADPNDDFADLSSRDYTSFLLHEMFHRYQISAFPNGGFQDVEGYAYTAENLELAVLEERALSDALAAGQAEDREIAAARFAAIRQARLAADARVVLDEDQEVLEGTARYIEHGLGADATSGYQLHGENYADDLVTDFAKAAGIKETFGFGRWYASGAAALRVLDLLAVDDVAGRVEAGESPAAILADELGVTEANRDRLVVEARAAYDPDAELPEQAIAAAAQAETEGSVFGDDDPSEPDDGDSDADGDDAGSQGDGEVITDEELACLEREGVDLEAEAFELTEEQFEACLA